MNSAQMSIFQDIGNFQLNKPFSRTIKGIEMEASKVSKIVFRSIVNKMTSFYGALIEQLQSS